MFNFLVKLFGLFLSLAIITWLVGIFLILKIGNSEHQYNSRAVFSNIDEKLLKDKLKIYREDFELPSRKKLQDEDKNKKEIVQNDEEINDLENQIKELEEKVEKLEKEEANRNFNRIVNIYCGLTGACPKSFYETKRKILGLDE